MHFRNYVSHIVPPWLRRYWGERLVGGAIGLYADLLMEGGAQATKAPWLRSNTSPDDALPRIGDERNVPKVDGETPDEYRERLANAWELWGEAGTVTYGANVLEAWGFTPAGVFVYAWKDGDQDAAATHWSKYSVVALDGTVGADTVEIPFRQAIVGVYPLTLGDGSTVGSSATVEQVRGMCSHIWHFKSGHEVPQWLYMCWGYAGGAIWGAGSAAWDSDAVRIPLGNFIGHNPTVLGASFVPRETTVPAVWGVRFHS